MTSDKEVCLQCGRQGWLIDMFEITEPVEANGDRISEFYCSQTCMLERLQGKVREVSD